MPAYRRKARTLLYAYLLRLNLTTKGIDAGILEEGNVCFFLKKKCIANIHLTFYSILLDQKYIVQRSVHILQGLLQIATVKQWLNVAVLIMDLQQDLLQGLYPGDASIKQLPHIDNQLLRRHSRAKKQQINSVQQFLNLSEPERKSFLKPLTESEYLDVVEVAQSVPRLSVEKAVFKGK